MLAIGGWLTVAAGLVAATPTTGASPLIVLLTALLGGSLAAALLTFAIERRKLRFEREKEQVRQGEAKREEILAEYTKREERDSLIADASERAISFMRKELEVAQKALEETRREVERLKEEVHRLEAMVQIAREERETVQTKLEKALQDLARRELRAQELDDRVRELEAATHRRRVSDRKPKSDSS